MAKIIPELIQKYHHPRFKILVGDLTIYDTEFITNSFSYRTGTGSGEFAPGGCVIASCSFALNNDDGRYNTTFENNAPVMVYIGYGRTAATATYDILCCVFAAEIKKKKSIISVTCYDKLRQADKVKWTTYSFPMTVNQIITAAATQAGISVQTLPPAGGDISVDLRDENGNQPELNLTCRQALSSATLIAGCYGYVSYDNLFVCGWYKKLADTTVDANWMFDYEINDPLDYTGVQVFGQEVKGDATRLFKLSSGDFITEANCAAIQDRLYDALVGLPVRQATIKMVCNPNIRPGMSVMLAYNQGGQDIVATIPITSMTIKSGMSAEYVCETISPDEADDLRKDDESSGSTGSGQYGATSRLSTVLFLTSGSGNASNPGIFHNEDVEPMSIYSKDNSMADLIPGIKVIKREFKFDPNEEAVQESGYVKKSTLTESEVAARVKKVQFIAGGIIVVKPDEVMRGEADVALNEKPRLTAKIACKVTVEGDFGYGKETITLSGEADLKCEYFAPSTNIAFNVNSISISAYYSNSSKLSEGIIRQIYTDFSFPTGWSGHVYRKTSGPESQIGWYRKYMSMSLRPTSGEPMTDADWNTMAHWDLYAYSNYTKINI